VDRPPRLGGLLALAVALAAGPACDDKLQSLLKKTSERHEEREGKKPGAAERQAHKEAAISPDVRRAIELVRTSDYDFVSVASDGMRKRYSGFDFAGMLETKSRWLGRGLDDLPLWLDQIGSNTFFGRRSYMVRLPNGRELNFRAWLEAEIAALPTVAAPKDPT
jgi:hypothetical protein